MAAGEAAPERRRVAGEFEEWLVQARLWFVGGALASLIGFVLPWFRISRSYLWWYGGWGLLTTNDPALWWIALLFLGYAVLVLGGYPLLGFGAAAAGAAAALAAAVALGTLVVVGLAAADAVNGQGRVYALDWHLGLFLMIPGHAAMLVAAFVVLVLQLLKELLPRADGRQ